MGVGGVSWWKGRVVSLISPAPLRAAAHAPRRRCVPLSLPPSFLRPPPSLSGWRRPLAFAYPENPFPFFFFVCLFLFFFEYFKNCRKLLE